MVQGTSLDQFGDGNHFLLPEPRRLKVVEFKKWRKQPRWPTEVRPRRTTWTRWTGRRMRNDVVSLLKQICGPSNIWSVRGVWDRNDSVQQLHLWGVPYLWLWLVQPTTHHQFSANRSALLSVCVCVCLISCCVRGGGGLAAEEEGCVGSRARCFETNWFVDEVNLLTSSWCCSKYLVVNCSEASCFLKNAVLLVTDKEAVASDEFGQAWGGILPRVARVTKRWEVGVHVSSSVLFSQRTFCLWSSESGRTVFHFIFKCCRKLNSKCRFYFWRSPASFVFG